VSTALAALISTPILYAIDRQFAERSRKRPHRRRGNSPGARRLRAVVAAARRRAPFSHLDLTGERFEK